MLCLVLAPLYYSSHRRMGGLHSRLWIQRVYATGSHLCYRQPRQEFERYRPSRFIRAR
jgi:hypothetical protein